MGIIKFSNLNSALASTNQAQTLTIVNSPFKKKMVTDKNLSIIFKQALFISSV